MGSSWVEYCFCFEILRILLEYYNCTRWRVADRKGCESEGKGSQDIGVAACGSHSSRSQGDKCLQILKEFGNRVPKRVLVAMTVGRGGIERS
mmetsp:Transcript_39324/g.47648  ORF Transcript_39324/g.47648 Transcript_39324/m.47648 type:complete len:92 (-) Transcript_39324:362-637(-)